MAYHIVLFTAFESAYESATTNPAANRDNYVIPANLYWWPDYPVEINAAQDLDSAQDFCHALLWANFIYTGQNSICFWDNGADSIFVINQNNVMKQIYNGGAADLVLQISADGTISFEEVDKFDLSKAPKLQSVGSR